MDRMYHHGPARLARRAALALALLATAACTERPLAPPTPTGDLTTTSAPPMTVVRDPDIFCPFGCDAIAAGDSMQHMVRFATIGERERFSTHAQWSSADERIATVSSTGMVTGRAPGEVEIRATVGTQTSSLVVMIGVADIDRVEITAPTTSTDPRGSIQLAGVAIDVLGEPVRDAELFWFSATPNVASVDQTGRVTGVGPGEAMVMAFASFGRSAWVSIHVNGTVTTPALPVASIDVGGTQTCSTSASGVSSCWGFNHFGQLGTGSFGDIFTGYPTPQPVDGGFAFTSVSAGDFHSCALTAAGEAYCWGSGSNGRLGNGGASTPSPTRVVARQRFASIAAGGDNTCAVDTQGAAFCWGFGGFGQLGTGTAESAQYPTALATDVAFAKIFPSLWHSCALSTEGQAYCWGSNDFGQVGNGRTSFDMVLAPSRVLTPQRFTMMDSRFSHACGVTATGATYCWGRNDQGQLGDGSFESRGRPVRVAPAPAFTTVATAGHHTCALTAAGEAWCWGNNEFGQLGDNTLISRTTPAPVFGAVRFTSLTGGNNVTCGTTTAGEAWCWGTSHFAMLGNGQQGGETMSAVPVRVIAK